ncbi:MAG: tRNA (cytidine(34)-2'-O)-methyltransferase [Planctomycetales bacterium]|nr:tRNA (cytidine(34)-2'-O)-methyltransferase [Planctomycetales bacterium]
MNVVLHQPEIPQNTGNIGRTCVAVGAKLWLIRPLGFRVDDQRMRRAGLDYWPHLDLEIVDSWAQFAEQHKEARLWYFTKTAERSYVDVDYSPGDFLVFGSETNGLPPTLIADAESAVRIPQSENVRSLNLSNAVAIAVYEAKRQNNDLA